MTSPHVGSLPDDRVRRIPDRRFELTELGSARRLIATHGDDLLFVADANRWHCWDGRRWSEDVTGEVHRRLKSLADELVDEIKTEPSDDRRKLLVKHAVHAQTARGQRGILTLAETELDVVATLAELDSDPWVLNVANGTLDLRRGRLRAHHRADRITKLAPVAYDPDAPCPTWEAFIAWATGGRADLAGYLQRHIGYTLTGDVSEQVLAFCHGAGSNGKSTLLGVLQALLGLDRDGYALQAAPRLLVATRHVEHPTAIADLVGRRLIVCQEIEQDDRLDEVRVKELTGGDPVKARFMREDYFTFRPTGKFWLAANHKPKVRGTDHAIWRRMRLIPFDATVTDEIRDPHLAEKLERELAGILAWAVRGCTDWLANGLDAPKIVLDATNDYRHGQDVIAQFIDDCCELDETAITSAADLYKAYTAWCDANGERALTQRMLGPHLHERGLERGQHGRKKTWCWTGIAITDTDQPDLSAALRGPSAVSAPTRAHDETNGQKGRKGRGQESEIY